MGEAAVINTVDELFALPEKYACAPVPNTGGRLLDGGVNAPGGWQAGLLAVKNLLSGYAEVCLDHMQAGDRMVPTLDVYLDRAVAATRALTDDNGVLAAQGTGFALVLADTLDTPAPKEGDRVLVAAPHSLVGHLADAGMALPREVKSLLDAGFCPEEIFWGHSASPIVLWNKAAVRKAGQLVGLWLRCGDEELAHYTANWQGDGELRLHNLRTGSTFLAGAVDEEALGRCLVREADKS